MTGKKYLVTGGTGFIGSNLTLKLLENAENEVFITGTENEQKMDKFNCRILPLNLEEKHWDSIGKLEVLYHQAAINDTLLDDREKMFEANIYNSIGLFENAIKRGCKKIVYASSTAVYGNIQPPFFESDSLNPLNVYAESKKILDEKAMELAQKYPEVKIIGLRYCNVYGPRENHKGKRASMIYQLAQQMLTRNPKLFKWGEQKRDYIYVKDAIEANLLASNSKESCILNCGSGRAVSFNEIVGILNKILFIKREIEYIKNPYKETYQNHTECNMDLAKEKIGFKPKYTLEKGIRDYYHSKFLTIDPSLHQSIF